MIFSPETDFRPYSPIAGTTLMAVMMALVDVAGSATVEAIAGLHPHHLTFTFYQQTTDWHSAFRTCEEKQMSLLTTADDGWEYLVLQDLMVSSLDTKVRELWTGYYQQADTDSLVDGNNCSSGAANATASRGCLTLVLTAESGTAPSLTQANCTESKAFVCISYSDSMRTVGRMVLSLASLPATVSATRTYMATFDDCRRACKESKICIGASYDAGTSVCMTINTEVTSPITYELMEDSDDDETVHTAKVYHTISEGLNTDVITMTSSDSFPCVQASAATTTITTHSAPVTSTGVSTSFTQTSTNTDNGQTSPTSSETTETTSTLSPTQAATSVTTTSRAITSTLAGNSTSPTLCPCACPSGSGKLALSQQQLDAIIAEITERLQIDRKQTSFYMRKLRSADDRRVSAQTIGWCAATTLAIFAIGLVVLDARNFCLSFKILFENVEFFLGKR